MKSASRKRSAILVSCLVILLCMSIIGGVTWALFSDSEKITDNHLRAGELDITLERTKLTKTYLDPATGYLVEADPDTTTKDFTNNNKENVFDVAVADQNGEGGELIAPGCTFVADLKLTNNSDVAFKYWVEIELSEDADPDLAKQLKIVVTVDGKDYEVENGKLIAGSEGSPLATLAKTKSGTFTVSVEFLDSFDANNGFDYYYNDDAQGDALDFDLVVYAVQATKAP